MKCFVFVGPTLSVEQTQQELPGAIVLPPASQGDVYAATRERPLAIGIIDGLFERVPAVWHKEILWSLCRGVHVFGSASLGALRAAELCPLGMEGVGDIFESLRRGELTDDDEVTLVHGPAEAGYPALSEAMVNMRRTIDVARAQGIIGPSLAEQLVALAKGSFYPERSYPRVVELAEHAGHGGDELDAFRAWWPQGRVDQKQADARQMLRRMAELRERAPGPKQVTFHFQHTDAWEQVRRQIDRRPLDRTPGVDTYQHDALLDELRLRPELLHPVRQRGLTRSLAITVARRDGVKPTHEDLAQVLTRFRQERSLHTPEQMAQWLDANALTVEELTELLEDEVRARRTLAIHRSDLERVLPEQLRIDGHYPALARRARHKHVTLTRVGLDNPSLGDASIPAEALWLWFFEQRCGQAVPPSVHAWAVEAGFIDQDQLQRAVLREYCYCRELEREPQDADRIGRTRSEPDP